MWLEEVVKKAGRAQVDVFCACAHYKTLVAIPRLLGVKSLREIARDCGRCNFFTISQHLKCNVQLCF